MATFKGLSRYRSHGSATMKIMITSQHTTDIYMCYVTSYHLRTGLLKLKENAATLQETAQRGGNLGDSETPQMVAVPPLPPQSKERV